ncbi:stromal interaction molecule homolog isoform X2 [Centruroides sculpturatus]|uniref:stromal interaction molecule homolog isoform X2 n=1 Tax=Centruroides sculpturatus TaxID=218467 RepID=UPI000C6C9BDF|nr:stromal interaction molecule homolog isoform X2 [Centruroides sculpturatus]
MCVFVGREFVKMLSFAWIVIVVCLLTIDCDHCTYVNCAEVLESSVKSSTFSHDSNVKVSKRMSTSSSVSSENVNDEEEKWDCEAINACSDKMGYNAIVTLHQQLDDDANGNIDIAESDEFLRDELQYENGYDRQKGFHRNDKYISVDELWQFWITSEVHNWTMEETIEWLVSSVELPQYVKNFQENAVTGTTLPTMAVNMHFLNSVLGIKDSIHKHKIALKAMDVVLFGPPRHHNYVKDVLLVFSLVIAIGGCWFAYVQHKYAQTHMRKMMTDMESLQRAEETLLEVQKELDKAKMEHESVMQEKKNLEQRLHEEISIEETDNLDTGQSRLQQLEQQLQNVREELKVAKKALESRSWVPPPALQHWLQMTHELELRHYNAKRSAAEQQLAAAKEGCEKLRKRRSSFLGSFRIAHGGSIDDVDNRILQAKAALSEVTKDLQERLHRWKQIELLCGFPIVVNPGLIHLESLLQRNGTSGISVYPAVKHSTSNEGSENDDDVSPPFGLRTSAGSITSIPSVPYRRSGFCLDIHNDVVPGATDVACILKAPDLKHCSSSSAILQMNANFLNSDQFINVGQMEEKVNEEYATEDTTVSMSLSPELTLENIRPNFTLGDSPQEALPPGNQIFGKKIVKSHSQDNHFTPPREIGKKSLSESCLNPEKDSSASTITDGSTKVAGRRKKSSNLSSVFRSSILDEEGTTDSSPTNSIPEEGQKDKKKKFLPHLKKKKSKVS